MKPRGKRTPCHFGHTHDSRAEATHCNQLHNRQALGEITNLQVQNKFDFYIDGKPVILGNNHVAGWKCDFTYVENDQKVACESKSGLICPSYPLRKALFLHLYPDWVLVELKK